MALVLNDVILKTNEALYGWLDVQVSMSIEQACNTFSLTSTQQDSAWLFDHPAELDAPCHVLFGNTPVINGYIEQLAPEYDDESHTVKISGRDVTADIVDSSALIPNQELRNVTIAEAAKLLCAPHGVTIDCPAPGEPFEIWAVNDGETVFDSIEQHARQRQLLTYTSADGRLHIKKAQPVPLDFTLKEGEGGNILKAGATHRSNQQFGRYIVKSQKEKGETSHRHDITGTHPRSNRVFILRPEKPNDSVECAERGTWENKVRRARGRRANVTVNGWESLPGQIWRPLQLPILNSPRLGFDGPVLVTDVTLRVNDKGGAVTELALCDPEVYV